MRIINDKYIAKIDDAEVQNSAGKLSGSMG
jgi:hypothetical protein